MKMRSYLVMGSHDPNTAEQISVFRVTEKCVAEIAQQWREQFPYVSYVAIDYKHSKIHCEREKEK